MADDVKYYYNLSTGAVEEGRQSRGEDLMGPYDTREEAQHALQIAAARNEEWEQEDKEWKDFGDSSASSDS